MFANIRQVWKWMSVINELAYAMNNHETLLAKATANLDTLINELENRKELKNKHSEGEKDGKEAKADTEKEREKV
jgi:hypothetical protein